MDITIGNRNELSKRFNFVRGADGDVSFDDTEAHAVITSVIEHRRSYWVDPNHGSELFTLKNLSSRTPSQAEAMTIDSVAQLEADSVIVNPQATAAAVRSLGRLTIDLSWTTPSGAPNTVTVEV